MHRRGGYKRLASWWRFLLGNEERAVPREEDGLPDVRQVEQFLDEPVEAEAPSVMGRHAVSEGLQVEVEVLDVQAFLLHPLDQLVVAMLPLAPRRHFIPLVLEIKGISVLRIVRLRHHVERLDRGGISGQEV